MRKSTVALILLFLVGFPVRLLAHEGHGHKVMGTVAAVEAGRVAIDTKDGEKVSVVVNKDTKFLRGKIRITVADIEVGERIVATVVEKGDERIAREIRLVPKKKESSSETKEPQRY